MNKKLQWLEAMRALAACWVLLRHANQSVSAFVGDLGAGSGWIANGYLGVDFFFVLSGFIIAFSSNRLLDTGRGFGDYARARLIRIYIPYLPVGIAMLLLYTLLPGLSAADRDPGVITSLTLLPTASPPALSVAWTLVHELLFYALFSLIFISRRLIWSVLAVWACLIAYFVWSGAPPAPGWTYLVSPLNLCFLLGVSVYYLTRAGVSTWVALGTGLCSLLIILLEAGQSEPKRWLLSLAFSGLIVCALNEHARRWSPGKLMLFLGAASYAIYLVHNPVLSLAVRIVDQVIPHASPAQAFLLISVAALLAGVSYFYFYERHGLALARKFFEPVAARRVEKPSTTLAERA